MSMEDDPDKINDLDRALEAKVVAVGKTYQASRVRSRSENAIKAKGRKEIDELGFRTDAYQAAIRVARDLTPAEQKQYVRDLRFFLKVFGANQADLWPEDAAKAEARAKRKAERKAKAAAAAGGETKEQQERRIAADTNPRSDPKNGGAGKKRGSKKDNVVPIKPGATIKQAAAQSDAVADAIAQTEAAEQSEGERILSAAGGKPVDEPVDNTGIITGKPGIGSVADEVPLSQSEIARQKLVEAKLA